MTAHVQQCYFQCFFFFFFFFFLLISSFFVLSLSELMWCYISKCQRSLLNFVLRLLYSILARLHVYHTQAITCCSNHKTLRASLTLSRSPSELVRRRKSPTTLHQSRLLQNCSPKYATGYAIHVIANHSSPSTISRCLLQFGRFT